ncbi:MAG: hypothetical protein JRH16_11835 [Deltaproteobacteria bacterium]|nr:hypothetical protein [Deltaproteobacteria bacterium]
MIDYDSYPHTRLEPYGKRLQRVFQRLRGRGGEKRQKVYLVDLGDRRLKRVVFEHAASAEQVGECLQAFQGLRIFPDFVQQQGRDLWVEFVEGRLVTSLDSEVITDLARIFTTLYSRDAVLRPVAEGPWLADVERDLRALREAGVLNESLHQRLRERLKEWTPEAVWIGYDYSDPRPANLLRCGDGSYRFIDVESLVREQLLGTGVAKACFRWFGERRQEFFAHESWRSAPLADASAPVLDEAFDFVELACLASWTCRSIALKKPLVRPELFEGLANRG